MNGRERHSTGYGSKYLYLPTGDKKPLEPDKSLLGKFFSETRLGKSTIGSLRAIVRSLPTFVSLATLLASTLTLLYVVRPDLKSPEKLGATISKVEIELGVARGDYNQETHAASDTKPFDTEGVMIYATIDLEGFRRRAYIIDQ